MQEDERQFQPSSSFENCILHHSERASFQVKLL